MRIKYQPTVPNSLNSSLNIRYNPETDKVQIFYNNEWRDWKTAGLQTPYIYNLGEFVMDMSNGVFSRLSTFTPEAFENTVNGLYFGTSLNAGYAKTVVTDNLIDLSGYSKLNVEYSNNGSISTKNLDISSIQNGYIAAYFTRSGSSYWADAMVSSTKENFETNKITSFSYILPTTSTFPSNFYIRKIWLE